MCMSTAYERRNGADTLLCKDIREARVEGDTVVLVDIMGEAIRVEGTITKVDLMRNTMYIEAV